MVCGFLKYFGALIVKVWNNTLYTIYHAYPVDPIKAFAIIPHVAWLLGLLWVHHGVSPKHLQADLNEYGRLFNRRLWSMVAFDSVLRNAVRAQASSYEGLCKGEG